MMSIRIISVSVLFLLSASAGGVLSGQTLSSEMEFMTDRKESGTLDVGADACGGALHLAQEAGKKTDFYFNASGMRQVGRFHMRGAFLFRQSFENGVRYASTFHPLRPMPYIIADSTGGNWRKQDYIMDVDISMPVIADRLSLGLAMDLEAGRGAKNTDPRPQAALCDVNVMPSLSLNVGMAGVFSAGFSYDMYRESSDLILYDSSHPQKLYLLKGLGQYVYEVFSTNQRERKYEGQKLGGRISWTMCRNGLSLDVRGCYRNGMERVFDIDYNKPHDRGRYVTHEYDARVSANLDKPAWGGSVFFEWDGSIGSGREIVQHYESSESVNSWVTDSENPARYVRHDDRLSLDLDAWLKDAAGRRTWNFTARMERRNIVQEYRATSSYMRQDVLGFAPSVERCIFFPKGSLELGLSGDISHLVSSRLDYTVREEKDTNISEGLIYHDFNLPLDRYGFRLSSSYCWLLKNGNSLRLGGNGSFLTGGRLNRWTAGLSLGYSF